MNNFLRKVSVAITVVLLPVVIVISCLQYATFDRGFFEKFQKENNITAATGKTQEDLNLITEDLLRYIETGNINLLEKHFNSRETTHMVDVYHLYQSGYALRNFCLMSILIIVLINFFSKNIKTYVKELNIGFFILWIVILILSIIILKNFSTYFIYFHEIFFDNDLWLLNPETDLMIQMLPENFFSTVVRRVLIMSGSILAIIHVATAFFSRRIFQRRNHEHR